MNSEDKPSSAEGIAYQTNDSYPAEDGIQVEEFSGIGGTPSKNDVQLLPRSTSSLKRGSKNKVAFISVKRPAPSNIG